MQIVVKFGSVLMGVAIFSGYYNTIPAVGRYKVVLEFCTHRVANLKFNTFAV